MGRMPRNGASSTAGRKLRGEEKNKAKWMNEAKRNKKRAEEAESKLQALEAKLSTAPSNTTTEVEVEVSRDEFDALKAQLAAVKSAHDAALREKSLAEHASSNERGVLRLRTGRIEETHGGARQGEEGRAGGAIPLRAHQQGHQAAE